MRWVNFFLVAYHGNKEFASIEILVQGTLYEIRTIDDRIHCTISHENISDFLKRSIDNTDKTISVKVCSLQIIQCIFPCKTAPP